MTDPTQLENAQTSFSQDFCGLQWTLCRFRGKSFGSVTVEHLLIGRQARKAQTLARSHRLAASLLPSTVRIGRD